MLVVRDHGRAVIEEAGVIVHIIYIYIYSDCTTLVSFEIDCFCEAEYTIFRGPVY